MRKLLTFSFLLLLAVLIGFSVGSSRADELDNVTSQLNKQQKQLTDLQKRQQQLSRDIASASLSLSQVSSQLTAAEKELSAIEKDLANKEKELAGWEADRDSLIRQLYKQNRTTSLEIFFSADDLDTSAHQFQYFNANLNTLQDTITKLNGEIAIFQSNKAQAKKLRDQLAALRSQYQASLYSSQSQLSSTSSQLSSLKSSIKNLTSKQEQLILAKFAATAGSETIGENEPASTSPPSNPGFPSRPAYLLATYGYPHRVGMSQYGAYGRAKSGQLYQTILAAYYKNTTLAGTCDKTRRINVSGYGSILLEDEYLTGIGEMPSSWGSSGGMEALKAQVVAARSYALNYVAANGSICTTRSCQVFLGKGAKNNTPWETAVDATCGKTLNYGGSPISAWYASTAGGYTLSSQEVWGGYRAYALALKDFGPNGAYDGPAYGNSPWYHKGWGSRTGSGYNPWLTEEELADLFNSLLLSKHSSSYNQYLSPIDKGGWSMSKVRSELAKLNIKDVGDISAVVTTKDDVGHTASIYVCSNNYPCGSALSYSGTDFRSMFNLRSRGTLAIWTALFDVGICSSSSCSGSDIQFR